MYLKELVRPWKLMSLALGTGVLIVGAEMNIAPDWDTNVSLLMAGSTYLLAPWVLDVFWYRRWKLMPVALLAALTCIDSLYALYWGLVNPEILMLMRSANFNCSVWLFLICGFLWRIKGPLVK